MTTNIVITLLTTGFGLIAFTIRQFILEIVVRLIAAQRQAIGRIIFAITFDANKPLAPADIPKEQRQRTLSDLRHASVELLSASPSIPCYPLIHRLGLIPSRAQIQTVHRSVIGVSNSRTHPAMRFNEIRQLYIAIYDALE